jgi:hypothetical protein
VHTKCQRSKLRLIDHCILREYIRGKIIQRTLSSYKPLFLKITSRSPYYVLCYSCEFCVVHHYVAYIFQADCDKGALIMMHRTLYIMSYFPTI